MTPRDAANILNISGLVTKQEIKLAYKRAAKQFHPDKNPAGLEMMKMVNAAWDVLKDFEGDIGEQGVKDTSGHSYPEAVNEALQTIIDLVGIDIEICGAWVWVSGDTYQHKTILSEAQFRYAGKKKRWYFRPEDWQSSSRGTFTMTDIRDKYGSDTPAKKTKKSIAHA